MRQAVLAAVLASAACGGSKQAEPAQACATAAQHGVDAMINQAKGRLASAKVPDDVRARMMARQQKLEGVGAKMRALITNRCVEDKWPTAVVDCWTKAGKLEEIRACRAQLAPEQQARLQKDELDLFAAPAGPPGFDQTDPGAAFHAPVDPRLETLKRAINDAMKQVAEAKTDAERQAAQAQLDGLQADRKTLEAQIAAASGSDPATQLAARLAALDTQVAAAVKRVMDAQSDTERAAAKQELEKLRDQKKELEAQQQAQPVAPAGAGSAP